MEEQQGFNPTFENGGFWEYYKDLERQFEEFLEYVPYLKVNEIRSKQVIFKCLPERIPITPFKETKPEWWDFYNDIKHDITPSFSKANLKNVRDALAGAFLLNVVFESSINRLEKHGIVK